LRLFQCSVYAVQDLAEIFIDRRLYGRGRAVGRIRSGYCSSRMKFRNAQSQRVNVRRTKLFCVEQAVELRGLLEFAHAHGVFDHLAVAVQLWSCTDRHNFEVQLRRQPAIES